jgi:hypothetical protein
MIPPFDEALDDLISHYEHGDYWRDQVIEALEAKLKALKDQAAERAK